MNLGNISAFVDNDLCGYPLCSATEHGNATPGAFKFPVGGCAHSRVHDGAAGRYIDITPWRRNTVFNIRGRSGKRAGNRPRIVSKCVRQIETHLAIRTYDALSMRNPIKIISKPYRYY